MIVLDTNVLSELMKPEPSERVVHWISKRAAPVLFTTTITQAEIYLGIEIMAPGKRKNALRTAARDVFEQALAGRILAFDSHAAVAYSLIASAGRAEGKLLPQFDAQIAAIAQSRAASVATRNVADFARTGISVVNPWTDR